MSESMLSILDFVSLIMTGVCCFTDLPTKVVKGVFSRYVK